MLSCRQFAMMTNGWPDTKQQVPTEARPYWSFRDKVVGRDKVVECRSDGLLFKETRPIVPKSVRAEMLRQIHKSHLGKSSADREPGMCYFGLECRSVNIEQMVNNYGVCANYVHKQPWESLRPNIPPSLPWKKIGRDLFEFRGEHYLLSVCYRSKFPEVTKLDSLRSGAVVEELKRQFGFHGIPAEVV